MYFFALSQAPPVLDMDTAICTPDTKAPARRPARARVPKRVPQITGDSITRAPAAHQTRPCRASNVSTAEGCLHVASCVVLTAFSHASGCRLLLENEPNHHVNATQPNHHVRNTVPNHHVHDTRSNHHMHRSISSQTIKCGRFRKKHVFLTRRNHLAQG
jgi:hypothetical protein